MGSVLCGWVEHCGGDTFYEKNENCKSVEIYENYMLNSEIKAVRVNSDCNSC